MDEEVGAESSEVREGEDRCGGHENKETIGQRETRGESKNMSSNLSCMSECV